MPVSSCDICQKIGTNIRIRQHYDGTWPDTNLGLIEVENFKKCPQCGSCYTVLFSPGGMFSDDDITMDRLNPVASAITNILTGDGLKEGLEKLLEEYLRTQRNLYFLSYQVNVDLTPVIPIAIKFLEKGDKQEKSYILNFLIFLKCAADRSFDASKAFPVIKNLKKSSDAEIFRFAKDCLKAIKASLNK